MVAVNLIEVRKRPPILQPGRAAYGFLRILVGLSACPALAGCVTDGAGVAGLAAGADTVSAATPNRDPSAQASAEPMDEKASALVAEARALAFADHGGSKPPEQIDLAMLAMRSNPNATHRLDGPSSPGATPDTLSPEAVMQRLRQLSRNPGAAADDAAQDGPPRDILARLEALSHRPAGAVTEIQPAVAPAVPPKSVSPDAIMRRMKELSGARPNVAAPAAGHSPQDGRKPDAAPDADAFGGLVAVVPAPDMARTPAVERAIQSAPGAAQ
jgi:hypothetical protein